MKPFVAAVVQAEIVAGDAAVERTAELCARAASSGAKLVVFPETWIPGYPAWLDVCRDAALWEHPAVQAEYRRMAESSVLVPGPVTDRLGAVARDHGLVLVVGVTERVAAGRGRGTLYNALLTFDADGALKNHHRKLVPTYTERMVWGGGDAEGLRAVETAVGRVGGLICWEHWMPLARQALHESGEDVHAAVWPTVKEMNHVACRHYAFEGRCWVLASGALMRGSALPPGLEPHPDRVPGPDAWVLRGGSAIHAPDGACVAGPVYDEDAILTYEIDPGFAREHQMTLDVGGHYSRPDQLRLVRERSGRTSSTAEAPRTPSRS